MILVVGATGLLGTRICERLRAEGQSVRALVRKTSSPDKVSSLKSLGCELATGDLKEPSQPVIAKPTQDTPDRQDAYATLLTPHRTLPPPKVAFASSLYRTVIRLASVDSFRTRAGRRTDRSLQAGSLCYVEGAARAAYHGMTLRSRKNLPLSVCGASVANQTAVSAPSLTDRGALAPPISVLTHPGHIT